MYPDKVLFGTDGYPFSAYLGWEESLWIANHNAGQALGYALTGMLDDRQRSIRHRATRIGQDVLSGNASALYGPRTSRLECRECSPRRLVNPFTIEV